MSSCQLENFSISSFNLPGHKFLLLILNLAIDWFEISRSTSSISTTGNEESILNIELYIGLTF
jgi:hypothetical protein